MFGASHHHSVAGESSTVRQLQRLLNVVDCAVHPAHVRREMLTDDFKSMTSIQEKHNFEVAWNQLKRRVRAERTFAGQGEIDRR